MTIFFSIITPIVHILTLWMLFGVGCFFFVRWKHPDRIKAYVDRDAAVGVSKIKSLAYFLWFFIRFSFPVSFYMGLEAIFSFLNKKSSQVWGYLTKK